jgi:hypothetical protein
MGARGSVVVNALCYKPEGRGFHTQSGEFLNVPNTSGRTRREMRKVRRVRRADKRTAICEPIV